MRIHGFTLLELSIVLVIIGLIVGGIMAGQSLIRSAELGHVATETNKVKTAINTFRQKYDALPGDMAHAYDYWGATCGADSFGSAGACNGNGDGAYNDNFNEVVEFAHHMGLAGIIPGSYTGVFGAGTAVSPYYTAGGGLIRTGVGESVFRVWNTSTIVYNRRNANYLRVSNLDAATGNTIEGFLTPEEAMAVDLKMDDGKINSGGLYISRGTGLTCTSVSEGTSSANPTIDLASTARDCMLVFWLE